MDSFALEEAENLALAVGAAMLARDKAAQALGMTLAEIRPGYARMTMQLRDDMLNGHNVGHGGLTFALADTAMAYACNSRNQVTLAHAANISFLAPARPGAVLTAEAHEQALAGRSGVYDVRVVDDQGVTIALFRGQTKTIRGSVMHTSERED